MLWAVCKSWFQIQGRVFLFHVQNCPLKFDKTTHAMGSLQKLQVVLQGGIILPVLEF
jgi:hypothetical protein